MINPSTAKCTPRGLRRTTIGGLERNFEPAVLDFAFSAARFYWDLAHGNVRRQASPHMLSI